MKVISILVFLILLGKCYPACCQQTDTSYFNDNGKKVSSLSEATSYTITIPDPLPKKGHIEKKFFRSGKLKSVAEYSDSLDPLEMGNYKEYYESGQLHIDSHFDQKRKLTGALLTYWENGKLKRKDLYDNDKLVRGECYNEGGSPIPHFDYEVMPQFPGGENAMLHFLGRNIRYPKYARKRNIQGEVLVQFIVEKTGEVSNVE
ncbi:MAG: energy transducer TonB, partial [Chitinophagaceae bacterium]